MSEKPEQALPARLVHAAWETATRKFLSMFVLLLTVLGIAWGLWSRFGTEDPSSAEGAEEFVYASPVGLSPFSVDAGFDVLATPRSEELLVDAANLDPAGAVEYWEAAALDEPGDLGVAAEVAAAYLRAGDIESFAAQFDLMIAEWPDVGGVYALYGRELAVLGNYTQSARVFVDLPGAKSIFQSGWRRDAGNTDLAQEYARFLSVFEAQPATAISVLETALEEHPDDPDLLADLSLWGYRYAEDDDRRAEVLRAALLSDPTHDRAVAELVDLAMEDHDPALMSEAWEAGTSALNRNGDDPFATVRALAELHAAMTERGIEPDLTLVSQPGNQLALEAYIERQVDKAAARTLLKAAYAQNDRLLPDAAQRHAYWVRSDQSVADATDALEADIATYPELRADWSTRLQLALFDAQEGGTLDPMNDFMEVGPRRRVASNFWSALAGTNELTDGDRLTAVQEANRLSPYPSHILKEAELLDRVRSTSAASQHLAEWAEQLTGWYRFEVLRTLADRTEAAMGRVAVVAEARAEAVEAWPFWSSERLKAAAIYRELDDKPARLEALELPEHDGLWAVEEDPAYWLEIGYARDDLGLDAVEQFTRAAAGYSDLVLSGTSTIRDRIALLEAQTKAGDCPAAIVTADGVLLEALTDEDRAYVLRWRASCRRALGDDGGADADVAAADELAPAVAPPVTS